MRRHEVPLTWRRSPPGSPPDRDLQLTNGDVSHVDKIPDSFSSHSKLGHRGGQDMGDTEIG